MDLGDDSWFNLRTSNTEPLLRLNVEARTAEDVRDIVDQVEAQIAAVTEAALAGSHVATPPPSVLFQMVQHPLTDRGIEIFLQDAQRYTTG